MAKVALLIGVSEYEPGLNSLPAAVKDVEAMQQVLSHPEMGDFAEADIIVLKNPLRQDMEEAIENLFAHRQKDDLLLVFFSGHGIKDDTGRLFLATRTTRKTPKGDLIRSSAVSASFIHESMSRSRSKRQVVILDSCFSGAFAEGLLAKDDGIVNIREQLGGEGRAVLTSSSSTQYSFEQQGSDLSIYTRYLIEGITTGAADLDEDEVVSIDELHDYASRKVREIQPTMRPEIYTSREGFKIRLTKVPQGDPKQKYRKEVARYNTRGEVTFVGRKILDALRSHLGLSEVEATAIEDEMLATSRQEFREKLQRYETDFTEALQQIIALNEDELNLLRQNLQQILGLRNEDTIPIEARVTAQIEAYKQHLQHYEQTLTEAMRQEYPLSQATSYRLQQMQHERQISDNDIAIIESRVAAVINAYQQKLQQYEQAFTTAVQQKYPLPELKRYELQQQQQILSLKDEDIAPIEARITAKIENYQQRLQQYEQVLSQEIEHEYPLGEEIRNELKRYQQVLELKDEEVAGIEEKVIDQRDINLSPTQIIGKASKAIPINSSNKLRLLVGGSIFAVFAVVLIISSIPKTPELSQNNESQPSASPSISSTNSPMTAEDFFKGGNDKYQKKDYQGAIEDFNQAIKINPNYANAYKYRGDAHYYLGDKEGAIEDYSQAIKINPNYANAYNNQGFVRSELGYKNSAIEDYSQAIKINPNYTIAYYNRGLARFNLGDKKGAIEDYNQAIKIDPNYTDAYYNKSFARFNLGDKKGAIEDLNQAIKISPNNDKLYYSRGIARYYLGDKKGEIEDYNQAIKINPNYADAYNNRGAARFDIGDKKGAIEDYNQAIKINPNFDKAYNNRGAARFDIGDKKGAIEDYSQAIKINSNYADAYNKRGAARYYLGDKEGAIEDYNQAIKINPNFDKAYYNRGIARYYLGDKKGEIEDYNQAIKINPNYADAYNNRGAARSDIGDKKGAIEDFQKAAELYKKQEKTADYTDAINRIKKLQ
ncbi:MAG: tetratricopeptide repeat protein [Nostoc sp.]